MFVQNSMVTDFVPVQADKQKVQQSTNDLTMTQLPEISYSIKENEDIFDYNSTIHKVLRVAKIIFLLIIVPAGLLYLIGKAMHHIAIKNFLVPALCRDKNQLNTQRAQLLAQPLYAERCKRMAIQTVDGVTLDTLMIHHPKQEIKHPQDRKYIIFFNGDDGTYENMAPTLMKISDETSANVYTFNYRGVGCSEGYPTSLKDLVMDGETLVQHLLSQGAHPANILIHGWSLGGGVGAHVAALHQQEGFEMNYCSDRTFASLTDEIMEMSRLMRNPIKRRKTVISKIAVFSIAIATTLVTGLIKVLGWNFKNLDCYQDIRGHKFIIYHRQDQVIPYQASLYKKLKVMRMTPAERKRKTTRQLNKIRARDKAEPYVREAGDRSYRPPHIIQLDRNISKEQAHTIPITETLQFDDYKANVAFALV